MIDGLKAILNENLDEIRNSPLIEFQLPSLVSVSTGEIKEEKFPIAKYKGLVFEDKGSVIEIRGSIHKFYNNGEHNYNKFGLSNIHLSIYELARDFKIDSKKVRITNLEFGVNLKIDFKPEIFLNSLIIHKGKKFNYVEKRNMQYKECIHEHYFIKIYDKGLQNELSQFILRIELKFIKMEKINGFGMRFLSDLLDPQKLIKLKKELLRVYDDILIGDITVIPQGLSGKDEVLFANGHNADFWSSILSRIENYKLGANDKAYTSSSRTFHRKVNSFNNLLMDTGADYRKLFVRKLIDSESKSLLEENRKRFQTISSSSIKCQELTNYNSINQNSKMSGIDRFSDYYEGDNFTKNINKELLGIDPLLYSDKKRQVKNITKKLGPITKLDI